MEALRSFGDYVHIVLGELDIKFNSMAPNPRIRTHHE
jgi:hypothetical protein